MKRHRTADLDPTSFGGRYTLLRRLAVGGMAEIYLARQAAMAGFEKEVVIKRLRAELADDPRIVEMFLDEARIGALLNHPNIVHVYDVDEHDGIPYIAMEYIVGEELNELCRRGITHDRFLPLEHAVELMRQAAAGMGYFHSRRSFSDFGSGALHADQPLEIVHLDISPSNLLVTQDGFLKIIDFGIASARGQRQRTDVIPGKLGYMSPEQASRKTVDHRSDIFSLGIVLYEITVGRRLFRGAAQDVVSRLVEAQVEPPTFVRRNFPSALESIVMRSLEKHVEDRYQSAYDLADDLETFLRDARMHSGPVRIARYLDVLTAAGGGPRRPELVSEAETRGQYPGDELDFDSQVFDGYSPSEGAPGPAQAPEWEDTEQPEADVAAALGLELAELRALRTPVPVIPAGMTVVSNRLASHGDERTTTNPVRRHSLDDERPRRPITTPPADDLEAPTVESAKPVTGPRAPHSAGADPAPHSAGGDRGPHSAGGDRGPHSAGGDRGPHSAGGDRGPRSAGGDRGPHSAGGDRGIDDGWDATPEATDTPPTERHSAPVLNPSALPPVAPSVPPVPPILAFGRPQYVAPLRPAPPGFGSRLPWILVGALGVAVAALVAYIVT